MHFLSLSLHPHAPPCCNHQSASERGGRFWPAPCWYCLWRWLCAYTLLILYKWLTDAAETVRRAVPGWTLGCCVVQPLSSGSCFPHTAHAFDQLISRFRRSIAALSDLYCQFELRRSDVDVGLRGNRASGERGPPCCQLEGAERQGILRFRRVRIVQVS